MGPNSPNSALAQPRLSLLRRLLLCPRLARRQHLRQLPLRRQRLHRASTRGHQYPPRPDPLRSAVVGSCPLEDSGVGR